MKTKVLKLTKQFVAILLSVVLVFSLVSCGKKQAKQSLQPTEKFFVNDFAEVLTDEDSNKIYTMGAALQEATTAQAIVVTVDSLEDREISDYALELGREWGIGTKEQNNGVVVLFSKSDREIYIAVGYGLEGALPDSKTGRIIDNYGIPYFTNDNFSAGLMSIYNSIVNETYIEYGITPQENYIPIDSLPDLNKNTTSAKEVIISWLVLIVLIAIYVLIFGRRGGMFIFGSPRFYSGGFNGNNFRGGGFGGFSGGGGSFGGGGAGRKF